MSKYEGFAQALIASEREFGGPTIRTSLLPILLSDRRTSAWPKAIGEGSGGFQSPNTIRVDRSDRVTINC